MSTDRRSVVLRTLCAAALCACAVGIPGCYERVVRSKGIGSHRHNVQEPYRSNTAIDRAYDSAVGDAPKTPKTSNPAAWETKSGAPAKKTYYPPADTNYPR